LIKENTKILGPSRWLEKLLAAAADLFVDHPGSLFLAGSGDQLVNLN